MALPSKRIDPALIVFVFLCLAQLSRAKEDLRKQTAVFATVVACLAIFRTLGLEDDQRR